MRRSGKVPSKKQAEGILGLISVLIILAAAVAVFYILRPAATEPALVAGGEGGAVYPEPPADAEQLSYGPDADGAGPGTPANDNSIRAPQGEGVQSLLEVLDRHPPEATPVHVKRYISDRPLDPNDFVTDVIARTPVAAGFYAQPDDRLEGDQEVMILLTNKSGNTSVVTSLLTLTRDTVPPVITGDIHKSIVMGDTVAYRRGVSVSDNRDGHITLEVDASAVDTRSEGVYTVIYSATDSSGNTVSVNGSLTVYGVTLESVEEMIDDVLEKITAPGMSQLETARAIYNYVKGRLIYGGGRIRNNVPFAAYRGLRTGQGDCYTFYALAEMLLTRAGIDNIPIQRIAGTPTTHFWSLVNIGEGWHHFDSMPRNEYSTGFMLTEAQAAQQTRVSSIEGYYTYDPSLYPQVVP